LEGRTLDIRGPNGGKSRVSAGRSEPKKKKEKSSPRLEKKSGVAQVRCTGKKPPAQDKGGARFRCRKKKKINIREHEKERKKKNQKEITPKGEGVKQVSLQGTQTLPRNTGQNRHPQKGHNQKKGVSKEPRDVRKT